MSNVTNVKAKRFTDGTAASTTAVAAAQTLGGAGNFTLAGGATGFAGNNMGQKITLTSGGNISAVTFTITGTDADGNTQSEDIAGPNATTVATTKYYASVTQIAADAAVGTNTSAGYNTSQAGIVFSGRTKIRGMHGIFNGAATVAFNNTSGSGTELMGMTVDSGDFDPYIPDNGVLFDAGAYVNIDVGKLTGLTVFFDG